MTTTRYDRHMYALMNDRRAAAVHATTTRRRLAVTAHVALTAVGVGAWIGTVFGPGWGLALVVAGALLPWVLLTGVLNGSTRGLLELRGRMLDERQLVERDRVRALAHRITLWLLVAAVIGAGAYSALADAPLRAAVTPVLVGVLAAHWMMPLWVAALRVQDELGDTEDEFAEAS
ncbi:hypothetical protein [Streptomyces gardneri]|uniref:Uncharacterized protein n=1 Tax=Streptomyces gardneri TaxID=66892 RepID=A0A4Y3RIX2_9ACTN|nr:hypothetical protein [Streptomyces gardneri]GEB55780.1 hypothetical protein SGA01_13850 [Streptomyces gardneri]GHH18710.1 hypothetical protein GCM10017674_70880 [Streptomyces gardneri]